MQLLGIASPRRDQGECILASVRFIRVDIADFNDANPYLRVPGVRPTDGPFLSLRQVGTIDRLIRTGVTVTFNQAAIDFSVRTALPQE